MCLTSNNILLLLYIYVLPRQIYVVPSHRPVMDTTLNWPRRNSNQQHRFEVWVTFCDFSDCATLADYQKFTREKSDKIKNNNSRAALIKPFEMCATHYTCHGGSFGLHNDLRWPDDGQIGALSLPNKSDTSDLVRRRHWPYNARIPPQPHVSVPSH